MGENFRFGAGRSGDTATLRRLAEAHGVEVVVLPMLADGGDRLSSSRIRRALSGGELQEAARLLGRPYRFGGRVVQGRGLGRQLGWPTANLQVDGRKFLPLEGVYAAWVWLVDDVGLAQAPLPAVMNLGPQPTVDPTAPSAVEVHLLGRRIELAGAELLVEPVALLRRQQRFENLEALVAQIAADAARAEQLLGSAGGVGVGQAPADEGGDRPLHVDRAAAIEKIALDFRDEGIGPPALARRHDVAMPGKGEMRRTLPADREQILDRPVGGLSR